MNQTVLPAKLEMIVKHALGCHTAKEAVDLAYRLVKDGGSGYQPKQEDYADVYAALVERWPK